MEHLDKILDDFDDQVDLENYLASSGIRFINYVLDRIVLYLFWGYLFLNSFYLNMRLDRGEIPLYLYLLHPCYWILFEFVFQKTPAKFLTRTKVVTIDGKKPDIKAILIRTFSRFVPFEALSFLGNQPIGWHDRWSKTRVVRDDFVLK